jgi:hypothetical protein
MTGKYTLEAAVEGLPLISDAGLGATLENVQICMEWIKSFVEHTKTIRSRYSSYTYKHLVERHVGKYIANRDFIVAAHMCGFTLKPDSRKNVNFFINGAIRKEFLHLFFKDKKEAYERRQKAKEEKELRAKWHAEYKARSLARKKAKQNEAQNR